MLPKKPLEGYDDGFSVACAVEESGRNDWGLFGVGGNVWEWTTELTADEKQCYSRGASWYYSGLKSRRCEYRYPSPPSVRIGSIGFRLVLSR